MSEPPSLPPPPSSLSAPRQSVITAIPFDQCGHSQVASAVAASITAAADSRYIVAITEHDVDRHDIVGIEDEDVRVWLAKSLARNSKQH